MHRRARGALIAIPLLAACDDDPPGPPDPPVVASVSVEAPAPELALHDTLRLEAVALDADGDTIPGRPVTWTSSAPGVLEVTTAGRVIAQAPGAATITATVDGVDGSVELTGVGLTFASVAAGDGVTCGLTAEGRAWCWGNVGAGGLGGSEGDSVFASVARPAGGTLRFAGLSLRTGGGCGTLLDATAACWGTNASGQLGDGGTAGRPGPGAVPGLANVAEVAAGPGHTCARGTGGQAWCWGANDRGQLGDGAYAPRAVPAAVPGLAGVTGVGVGTAHGCALLGDGSAHCWGGDRHGELGHDTSYVRSVPQLVPGLSAGHLGASWLKTCALDQAGLAWCWGTEGYVQGSLDLIGYVPQPVGGPAFTAIAVGFQHACALTAAGAAWCWGQNGFGELGDGSTVASDVPVPVAGGHSFVGIGAGLGFSCGLDGSGAAWCWGSNQSGRLGIDLLDGEDYPTPQAVAGGLAFASLGVGSTYACGLTAAGAAWCWGANGDHQLGADSGTQPQPAPVPVAGGHTFASLHVGLDGTSCGIEATGQAWCWGRHPLTHAMMDPPVAVGGGIAFATIAPGYTVICGLDTDGNTWCWGDNPAGQLGTDAVPSAPDPVPAAAGRSFVELAAGAAHACGREADGATWCWGDGSMGALGTGLRPDSPHPVTVDEGSGFQSIAVGGNGTCGVTGAAAVCWPPGASTLDFAQVSVGSSHSCGITAGGAAWCWGSNSHGQLGVGHLDPPNPAPAQVVGGLEFASISAGTLHTCGVTTAGETYCWGANAQGQLGAGVPRSTTKVAQPVRVEGQP